MKNYMPRYQAPKKRIGRTVLLCLLAVVAVAGVTVWGLQAKYVQESSHDAVVTAREFYFSSDLLQPGGKTYELNPDTTKVTFSLRDREDALRQSEDAVSYTVHCQVAGESQSTQFAQGVIARNADAVIELPVTAGKTYTVTAVGEAGYEKTLSATFVVKSPSMAVYKHLNTSNSAYVLLTVWTEDISGAVSVSVPAGLIPDGTDEDLLELNNYTDGQYTAMTFTRTFTGYHSETYRFFKTNTEDKYTVDQFAVALGGTAAVPGTP